jgi:hypothetical protein
VASSKWLSGRSARELHRPRAMGQTPAKKRAERAKTAEADGRTVRKWSRTAPPALPTAPPPTPPEASPTPAAATTSTTKAHTPAAIWGCQVAGRCTTVSRRTQGLAQRKYAGVRVRTGDLGTVVGSAKLEMQAFAMSVRFEPLLSPTFSIHALKLTIRCAVCGSAVENPGVRRCIGLDDCK